MYKILIGILICFCFLKINHAAVSYVFDNKFEECDKQPDANLDTVFKCTYSKMGVFYYLDKLNYNLYYDYGTKKWKLK